MKLSGFSNYVRWYFLPGSILLFTAIAFIFASRMAERQRNVQLEYESNQIVTAVNTRMREYSQVLVQTAAYFEMTPQLNRSQFRTYLDKVRIFDFLPGIQGVGWAMYRPSTGASSLDRLVITYLEPQDPRNRAAMGFDMMSEARRRAAIDRARDSGLPSLSGRVKLVQEITEQIQPGFLLYVPVYRQGARLDTVEQRRASFLGTIYAPFRATDLFRAIFGPIPTISFQIFASPQPEPAEQIFESQDERDRGSMRDGAWNSMDSAHSRLLQTSVGGQVWTIRVQGSHAVLFDASFRLPWVILIAGVLVFAFSWRSVSIDRQNVGLYFEAQKAIQIRDEFLAIVSHDLRNPLNAITMNAEILKRFSRNPTLNPAELEPIAARVITAGGRMNQLIQDLLDAAKYESGQMTMKLAELNLLQLAHEACDQFRGVALGKSIELKCEIDASLRVFGDALRIHQVLSNLLGNALKFTPEHGTIRISAAMRPEGQIVVSVSDTGKGIAPEDLPNVFRRFWIKDEGRRGTGLGLYIVDRIVQAHGGRIWVESELGKGSTFHFILKPFLNG